jgi:hypothetical protein
MHPANDDYWASVGADLAATMRPHAEPGDLTRSCSHAGTLDGMAQRHPVFFSKFVDARSRPTRHEWLTSLRMGGDNVQRACPECHGAGILLFHGTSEVRDA